MYYFPIIISFLCNEVQPEPKLTVEEFKQEAVEPEASASSPANPPADPPVSTVPQPRTTLEALEQRLAKYQSSMDQAQAEGNSSKVRRLGRIVKQYQAAIKASKAGRPVAFDELPDPPGKIETTHSTTNSFTNLENVNFVTRIDLNPIRIT